MVNDYELNHIDDNLRGFDMPGVLKRVRKKAKQFYEDNFGDGIYSVAEYVGFCVSFPFLLMGEVACARNGNPEENGRARKGWSKW
jgi:hypothetical protein